MPSASKMQHDDSRPPDDTAQEARLDFGLSTSCASTCGPDAQPRMQTIADARYDDNQVKIMIDNSNDDQDDDRQQDAPQDVTPDAQEPQQSKVSVRLCDPTAPHRPSSAHFGDELGPSRAESRAESVA